MVVLERRFLLCLRHVGSCNVFKLVPWDIADSSASYIETIDHRYSRNTWLLNRPADLLFLKNNIPAQRFAAMTSLMLWLEYWRLHELDDLLTLQQPLFKTGQWNDLWRGIAAMPRLQRLRVSIIKGRRRNDELWTADQALLDPLWAVTQPGEFVVWLSWPHQEDTEKFAGAPFRLEAPNLNS